MYKNNYQSNQSGTTPLIAPIIAFDSWLESKAQKLKSTHANIICITIMIFVVWGAVWQGRYNYDPHHWGLMLSNAKDLYDGKLPYQQIFIQYGFLTTAIHAMAYGWGGGNLTSIIAITAIAYAIGFWLIYYATLSLTGNIKIALYVFVTGFLIHPITIYPWSNYIAFPFLVYGISTLASTPQGHRNFFWAGISFGFAILSRESLAPAIIMLIILSTILDLLHPTQNRKNSLISAAFITSGLLLPVAVFFLYLVQNGLFPYWYKLSWLLPRIYATTSFSHVSGIGILNPLLEAIWGGSMRLDYRWMLLGMVFTVNLCLIILIVIRRKLPYLTPGVIKIAFATLLLLSSSLHIAEIFRLATGSVMGLIPFYMLLNQYKQANWFFIVVIFSLGSTLRWDNTGNYYFPSGRTVMSAFDVESPSIFKRQRWSKPVMQYYQNIYSDLKSLEEAQCGIAFHYNSTYDAYLQVLSPFTQYQIAPFARGPFERKNPYSSDPFSDTNPFNNLRPEFDLKKKISAANDIILFLHLSEKDFASYKPPEGFFVFSHYVAPATIWLASGYRLLILAPRICFAPLQRLQLSPTLFK